MPAKIKCSSREIIYSYNECFAILFRTKIYVHLFAQMADEYSMVVKFLFMNVAETTTHSSKWYKK